MGTVQQGYLKVYCKNCHHMIGEIECGLARFRCRHCKTVTVVDSDGETITYDRAAMKKLDRLEYV